MIEKEKQLKEKLDTLEHAVAQNPMSAEAWFNLGVFKYEQVDRDGAIDAFAQVLKIDPNHARTQALLKLALDVRDQERRKQDTSHDVNKAQIDAKKRCLLSRLLVSLGIILIIFVIIYAIAYPMAYEDLGNRYSRCAWALCSNVSALRQQIESWNEYFWPLYFGMIGVASWIGIYCFVRAYREARMYKLSVESPNG